MMNIEQILQYLPHRYPFLLVDRVLEMEVGKRILALKNVTINEPFFPGHFPHAPVMPGVLILEALAQAAAVLSFETMGTRPDADSIVYFAGIDEARFRRPVVPGDQLVLHCDDIRRRATLCKMRAVATVDGQVAAEAELSAAIVNKSALP